MGKKSPHMEKKQNIISRLSAKHYRLPFDVIPDDIIFESHSLYWFFWMVRNN